MVARITLFIQALLWLCSTLQSSGQCSAAFTFDDTDLTIQFMDLSTATVGDPIISWSWDFDDGGTSNLQHPIHTFPDPDKYDVVLIIATQSGCIDEVEIRIEICVLDVDLTVGTACDIDGNIELDISVMDIYDNADEIDFALDGSVLPGGPYAIDASSPVLITIDIPGDGLMHTLSVQSNDIATCNSIISFTAVDCNSNCFLSALNVVFANGINHNVNVDDNFFSPVSTTIEIGDAVVFQWVGGGQHSTTSDATSGPDAWNSGEIGTGSMYTLNLINPGLHQYYCIPHGGPNGSGMAGNIVANCPASNAFNLLVNFNTSLANAAGVNLYIDNVLYPGSPFPYAGTGSNSIAFSLVGDGASHDILLEDVADPTCTLTANYLAPDCGAAPPCNLSVSTNQTGGCVGTLVPHEVQVMSVNGGASGFNVLIDGNVTANSPHAYDVSGTTTVSESFPGDGQSHIILVEDVADNTCNAQISVTTPNCNLPCSIANLNLSVGSPVLHQVEVLDFEFFPANLSISVGDTVEFFWTGQVDHTTTSDATSGPDNWDSGLLGTGAVFRVVVLSAGVHPYYCDPHGGPNGQGMSGNITALAGCTNGQVQVTSSFAAINAGFNGFNVKVDGVVDPGSPFSYGTGGISSASFSVIGDGQSHAILIEDIDDPGCSTTGTITTPNCNISTCLLNVDANQSGGCQGQLVDVEISVSDVGGGPSGFNVLIDGSISVNSPYPYDVSGSTVLVETIIGDGQNHSIEARDIDEGTCNATTNLTTSNCSQPCAMTNLSLSTGNPVLHQIEVIDFDFSPSNLTISVGDTVEFFWTGQVDHTSTSDATSGPDHWDSGLLGAGSIYRVIIQTAGVHLYYCDPHGGPNGQGMSGTITALADCTNGKVQVAANFTVTNGGFNGFNVSVDGIIDPGSPFVYGAGTASSASFSVIGDGQSHSILIEDLANSACMLSGSLITPNCNISTCLLTVDAMQSGGCNGQLVNVEITVIDIGGGASGFNMLIDGTISASSPHAYDASGTTAISEPLLGDGQSHSIEIKDIDDGTCSASTSVTTTNCSQPCLMTNLTLSSGSPVKHQVEVIDFDFSPADIVISVGDTVEFVWTGQVDHSTRSDAASGTDSWDSGLLGTGSVYRVVLQSAGVHRYFCAPHGGPNGLGMAGTITALNGCTNGEVHVTSNFVIVNPGFTGFNVSLDGSIVSGSPFSYGNGATSSASFSVIGDGQNHAISIEDADNSSCSIMGSIMTTNCNATPCQLNVSASQSGSCNNGFVPVNVVVTAFGGGSSGFNLKLDGIIVAGSPFSYDTSGITVVSLQVIGDGLSHTLIAEDIDQASCVANFSVTTQNCSNPCVLSDLGVSFGDPVNHVVQVLDFEFLPRDITVNVGDTIRFDWVGIIPHTSTSDATAGPDAWDSGLLGQNSQYEIIITNDGFHQYYCDPHGGPGNVGMAGSITALASCDQGFASANLSFMALNASPIGYHIIIDSMMLPNGPFLYNSTNPQIQSVLVSGDGLFHEIRVQDAADSLCNIVEVISSPNCVQQDSCEITLDSLYIGNCMSQLVEVLINFSVDFAGNQGYQILIDGTPYLDSVFQYAIGQNQSVRLRLNGTGVLINTTIRDIEYVSCVLSIDMSIPQCGSVCQIINLDIQDGPKTHQIDVEDYEFIPRNAIIALEDTVLFVWKGVIPHSSRSDVLTGDDSWNSNLLNQGDSFTILLANDGLHRYYCEPHGGPNNIGMAGSIQINSLCNGDTAMLPVTFQTTNGSILGYRVFVDGHEIQGSPLNYQNLVGENAFTLPISGNGGQHILTIQDLSVGFCAASVVFTAPICGAGCSILDLEVTMGSNITHTIEVADFEFIPEEIDVVVGETVDFKWTGQIPHTTTSDALSGEDSWDSDLLGQGSSFEITLANAGEHPYYCSPHGGPNQIGMSGLINAEQECLGDKIRIQLDFTVTNGSAQGYYVYLDGNLIQSDPFSYENQMGRNQRILLLPGDGAQHVMTVQDVENNICAASVFVDFTSCGVECSLEDLAIDFQTPHLRIIEVRDFEFVPRDITVESGDILRFNWTGNIPHTVTSSVNTGSNVFNSGLLGLGAQWETALVDIGRHDYFCIPHGTAAGTGMAGSITVVDRCENDSLYATVSFSAVQGSVSGYRIFLDDVQVGNQFYPYLSSGNNFARFNFAGDGLQHQLKIADVGDSTCSINQSFLFPDCQDQCYHINAMFSYTVDEFLQEVSFVDESNGSVDIWDWSFDDGSTSTDQSPIHLFDSVGTYNVCLTVFDSTSNCSDVHCDKISLGAYTCKSDFIFNQEGLMLDFTNTSESSDSITQVLWTFGDDSQSNDYDTDHVYSMLGIYEICLTIYTANCEVTSCQMIDLSDTCLLFQTNFTYDTSDVFTISLSDLTSGEPDAWLWGFGDGTISRIQNPNHTYAGPGNYTICLLTSNSKTGCVGNSCELINIGVTGVVQQKYAAKKLDVYPNPNLSENQSWFINGLSESIWSQTLDIRLMDFAGRVITESKIIGEEQLILKTKLTSGLYVLHIVSESEIYFATLVVL